MDLIIKNRIANLYQYLTNDRKYSEKLNSCIDAGYWDLSIIIVWKYIMLFIYEKINQIEPQQIIKYWDSRYNKTNGKSIAEDVRLDNFYWANGKKDDEILTLLGDLYALDSNIVNQARMLLSDRNMCAHVTEIEPTESEFISFIDKGIRILSYIHDKHVDYLLSYIEINGSAYLSAKDKYQLINIYIENLIKSNNFDTTEKYERKLEIYLGYWDGDQLALLLINILKDEYRPNQIMDARYTIIFLKNLVDRTKEYWDTWAKFCENLEKFNYTIDHKFNNLKDHIQTRTLPF